MATVSKSYSRNKKQGAVKPMSILDLNRALAPTIKRTVRQTCHDYEGAYEYFKVRVADQISGAESLTWVQEGKKGTSLEGKTYIEIRLHSMPLYWDMKEWTDAAGRTADDEIKSPDGTVRETRRRMIGYSRYEVDSIEDGKTLLATLASQEDETFKVILTRAAEALKLVDDIENPDIELKAEEIYNANAEWVEKYGKWEVRDRTSGNRDSFSPEKTNKKNNAKQKARAALGYTRAKVVEYGVETA